MRREEYIDGMKGLACLFILLGHFTGIYKYAEDAIMIDSWFTQLLTQGPVSFFTAESFWLYLFFILSGYLLTVSSPPRKCIELLKKCIKRVVRFGLPVMGTAVFIFVIQSTIGFYNFKIQDTIQNTWLTHLYGTRFGFIDIIEEPFRVLLMGSRQFNSPFWCLRDMLLASLLIYAVGWFGKTMKAKVCILIALLLVAVIANRGIVIASCLVGSIIGLLKSQILGLKIPRGMIICGVVLPVAAFFTKNIFVIDVAFAIFLLLIPSIHLIENFLESDFVKKIGSISFGIYSLH